MSYSDAGKLQQDAKEAGLSPLDYCLKLVKDHKTINRAAEAHGYSKNSFYYYFAKANLEAKTCIVTVMVPKSN